MIVIINGSFGVGKTTTARLLRNALRGSAIYDPEWVGVGLKRLPKWIKLNGRGTDDFQDLNLWRKSAVMGIRLFRFVVSGPVIVPMTFSHRAYFDEVISGVTLADPELSVFCLKASLPTVNKRLAQRVLTEKVEAEWIARRNVECAEAHRDPHFGMPIDTEERTAVQVTEEIITHLGRAVTKFAGKSDTK